MTSILVGAEGGKWVTYGTTPGVLKLLGSNTNQAFLYVNKAESKSVRSYFSSHRHLYQWGSVSSTVT